MGRNKIKEALERSRVMNTPIGGVNCACQQHRKHAGRFIPEVSRKSQVRIFGANGAQVLPVWSGVSASYAQHTRNNSGLDVATKEEPRDYIGNNEQINLLSKRTEYSQHVQDLFTDFVVDVEELSQKKSLDRKRVAELGGKYDLLVELAQKDELVASGLKYLISKYSDLAARTGLNHLDEEKEVMSTLVSGLKSKGRQYVGFTKDLEKFLACASQIETGLPAFPDVLIKCASFTYSQGLMMTQRQNPDNELMAATVDYLKARYPNLIKADDKK